MHNAGFLKFVRFSTPDAAAIRFKHAAEAIMYADGFTTSKATPRV
jgi:hypothetical protein